MLVFLNFWILNIVLFHFYIYNSEFCFKLLELLHIDVRTIDEIILVSLLDFNLGCCWFVIYYYEFVLNLSPVNKLLDLI